MGVHDGHRARLKERFTEYGLDNFNDLNVLELLLFFVIPRQDTNIIAHALLDRFGSLDAVFEASSQELQAVPGIGLYGYQNEFVENGMRHKDYLYPDKGRVGFRLNLKATIWYSDFGVLVRYNPLASKDFGTTILSVGIAFRD